MKFPHEFDLIDWILNTQCATNGCTERVSRFVGKDIYIQVHGEVRVFEQNGKFCSCCRTRQLNSMSRKEAFNLTQGLPYSSAFYEPD
jgi:hypothetical protein